jgi:hypothetical protein
MQASLVKDLDRAFALGDDTGVRETVAANPEHLTHNAETNRIEVVNCIGQVVAEVPLALNMRSALAAEG